MRRHLSWIFAGTMLVGGLAACSDDDSDGDDGGTEQDSGDDGGSGDSGGGNAEVQAYCDDVEALAEELADAGDDPAALAELQDELTALQASGTELASNAGELDEDDSAALNECTSQLSEAFQPGG